VRNKKRYYSKNL